MIEGLINTDLEAVIKIWIVGRQGGQVEVAAIIDTGFNGFLTLPTQLIRELGLQRVGRGRAIVAHGGEQIFDFYGATVIWMVSRSVLRPALLRMHPSSGWRCSSITISSLKWRQVVEL